MTIGNLIKQYRSDNNLSMDEFSKRCSLSKGYISMLENNTGPRNNKPIAPTLPSLRKIASGMQIDIDTLLKLIDGEQQISLVQNYSDDTDEIVSYFHQLNTTGKEAATEQVRLLTLDEKYTRPDPVAAILQAPEPDYLVLKAAHNDAPIDDEELEKMNRDIELLKRLQNKGK